MSTKAPIRSTLPAPNPAIFSKSARPALANADLLTRKEAAAYLRVSLPTIDRLARHGDIQRLKAGRGTRFRRTDLDSLLAGEVTQ